jgi:hypothetical protein
MSLPVVVPALDEPSHLGRGLTAPTATEATPRGIQKTAITCNTSQRRRGCQPPLYEHNSLGVRPRFHAFLCFFVRVPLQIGTHLYSWKRTTNDRQ